MKKSMKKMMVGAVLGTMFMGYPTPSHYAEAALALGEGSKAKDAYAGENGAVAIGEYATAIGAESIAIGADNYQQVGGERNVTADHNSIAIGGGALATGTSQEAYAIAVGSMATANKDDAIAIGHFASANGKGSVAIGQNTTVTEDNVVGVGNRRITQVSDGVADTDAVNVSQLRNGMNSTYNDAKTYIDGSVARAKTYTDTSIANMKAYTDKSVTDMRTYTNSSVTNVKAYADNKAHDAEKNANAYTDKKVSASEKTVKAYADERANTAERNANAYTDKAITGIIAGTNGLDSHGYKVTNVADGDISPTSTDAVNGRQVYHLSEELRGEIAQVGAQSAALANLKPIFTDDSRVSAAVGVGNYKGATSAALGAFYRPDENTMISLSGAVGNSTNMVGVGFSYAFGDGSKAKKEKTSDTDEVSALKDLVRSMQQRIVYLEQNLK